MCIICIDFEKQTLTIDEARRALTEMISSLDPEHAAAVRQMLDEAERRGTPAD